MSLRYGWTGATHAARLRTEVGICTEAWLRDWCVTHGSVQVLVEAATVVPLSADEARVVHLDGCLGDLLLAVGNDELVGLGTWLAGVQATGDQEMAVGVATAALDDLLQRLAERAALAGAPLEQGGAAWPMQAVRPELGAVGMQLVLGETSLLVAMDRRAATAMCPPPSARAPMAPLATRQQSLDRLPIDLTAVLDFGSINARELCNLEPGEVLVGECPLGATVQLFAGQAGAIANARIGRAGERLAVVLVHSERGLEQQ